MPAWRAAGLSAKNKIAQLEEGRGEKRRQPVPAKGARRWKLGETLPPPEWSVPVATWERFSAPAAREGIHPRVVRKTEKKASKPKKFIQRSRGCQRRRRQPHGRQGRVRG